MLLVLLHCSKKEVAIKTRLAQLYNFRMLEGVILMGKSISLPEQVFKQYGYTPRVCQHLKKQFFIPFKQDYFIKSRGYLSNQSIKEFQILLMGFRKIVSAKGFDTTLDFYLGGKT